MASMFDIAALSGRALDGPRSVLRVVQLFARLAAQPGGETLTQLCLATGLPKTTLFTMLRTLEGAGYVTVDGGGLYRLGPPAVALGAAMAGSARRNFPECAREVLEQLSQRTGETCFLAVLTPDRQFCKYIATVEADNWLRFSVRLGSLKPAYATGSGRAMLAFLPPGEAEALLRTYAFDRLTPRTVSSRTRLLASLREVRQRGVSRVDSGTVLGVTAVAAPIFGFGGVVEAAVTVGGPSSRIDHRLDIIESAVRNTAAEISSMLGG